MVIKMKKIILLITIFLFLTSCQNQTKSLNKESNNISNETIIDSTLETNTYIDDNPIKVALYKNNHIVTSYNTELGNYKDITSFDIYYTNKELVDGSNTKNNYQKYYNEYESIDNYKNGFYITFEADGNQIEKLILDPTSQYAMYPYLYIYLYDDINQPDGIYYSHLEPADVNESTIISSIKLFLGEQGSKITSPITLTVFTYDSDDDFTEDNHYRGISSYTIEIQTN